jgi:transposase-like protein
MELSTGAAEFREAVRRHGGRGPRGKYTAELREQAVAYLRCREAAGARPTTVAKELGVDKRALKAWADAMGNDAPAPTFHPVELIATTQQPSAGRLTLHGPGGLRVEGLTVPELVTVLRGLR